MAAKLKKGDNIVVIAGREKGKKGEVIRVLPKEDRIIVKGVNMVKRHQRPTQFNAGGIVEKEAALHVSNVALQDPKSGNATRVGFKVLEDGRKVRVAKASGEVIDS